GGVNRADREAFPLAFTVPHRYKNEREFRLPRCGPAPSSRCHRSPRMKVFWEFVTSHAFFAIPMILMSLAAVGLVIWRLLLNFNARTDLNAFLPQLQDRLEKEGVEGAVALCKSETGVIPQKLYTAGLETAPQGLAAMRRAMANAIEFDILPDL